MSKTKQKPKNRNKPYKPKKDQMTKDQVEQIFKSGGLKALERHFSKFENVKPHHLQMTWNIFDSARAVEMYCLMNDLEMSDYPLLPLDALQTIYKGDLIVAIIKNLIEPFQKYKLAIKGKACKIDDPSVVIDVPVFTADFKDEAISYSVLVAGTKAGKYKFKRDGVFTTHWEGLTSEYNRFFESHTSEEYKLCDAEAVLSCTTQFKSWIEEKTFKESRILGQMRKFV